MLFRSESAEFFLIGSDQIRSEWPEPVGIRPEKLALSLPFSLEKIPSGFRSDPSDSERICSDPVGYWKDLALSAWWAWITAWMLVTWEVTNALVVYINTLWFLTDYKHHKMSQPSSRNYQLWLQFQENMDPCGLFASKKNRCMHLVTWMRTLIDCEG